MGGHACQRYGQKMLWAHIGMAVTNTKPREGPLGPAVVILDEALIHTAIISTHYWKSGRLTNCNQCYQFVLLSHRRFSCHESNETHYIHIYGIWQTLLLQLSRSRVKGLA